MDLITLYIIATIAVVPIFLFSIFAQIKVKSAFKKYKKINSTIGITGAQIAKEVIYRENMNTTVMQISGDDLNNYYSPKNDTVSLSATVYNSSSLSSLGVAAHEVGHAIQHNEHYLPVKIRTALAPAVTFMSSMAMPLIIIGLILEIFIFAATDSPIGIFIIMAGVVFYGSYAVFAFITLPVEFNASNRALVILSSSGTLTDKELKGAKKVLSAAAMTYVAAFLTSIIQFIRLLLRLVIILQATKRR